MEERKSKYVVGDIVTLVDGKNELWIVEKVTWWNEPPAVDNGRQHPYYHLRSIFTNETCEELNNTILKKDEGANLLYEQE